MKIRVVIRANAELPDCMFKDSSTPEAAAEFARHQLSEVVNAFFDRCKAQVEVDVDILKEPKE